MIARLLLLFCLLSASATAAEPMRIAIFDFEMIDTSLEGEMKGTSPEEKTRLAQLAPVLREKLAASGRYVVVDTAAVSDRARAHKLQARGPSGATVTAASTRQPATTLTETSW